MNAHVYTRQIRIEIRDTHERTEQRRLQLYLIVVGLLQFRPMYKVMKFENYLTITIYKLQNQILCNFIFINVTFLGSSRNYTAILYNSKRTCAKLWAVNFVKRVDVQIDRSR